jgi:long-chain fatty acid transport protein
VKIAIRWELEAVQNLEGLKDLQGLSLHLRMSRCFLTLAFCCIAVFSFAGGFQINAQGQRQLGMGHTGTGLLHNDASYLFFNPGAGAFLDRRLTITAGMSLLKPRVVYLEPAPGMYTAEMVRNTGTPLEFYASFRSGRFAFGAAVYTPFGSRAQWPDDWKGQFLIREINLKTIFIQPTVTWKLNEYIGIGAGFVYATGSFSLRKGVPTQNQNEEYGEGVLNGDASGMGYNVGIFLRANDRWSAGVSYRSSVAVTVTDGSAEFTVPSSLSSYFPSTTFDTELKLPSVLNAGIGFTSGTWKIAADFNYIGWSSYDSLRIDFADNTDKLEDIASARVYENAWIARVGAEWHPTGRFYYRLGTYYDKSPVQDGYLTPETPDADRIGITAGATVTIVNNLNLDLSLLFIEGMKRTDTNLETQFSGTYKSRVFAPGFGLTYQF